MVQSSPTPPAARPSTGDDPIDQPVEHAGDGEIPGTDATSGTRRAERWKARVGRFENAFNQRSASPKAKRWLLVVALLLFGVISYFSFRSLDKSQFRWWILPILAFVTTPLTVFANAAEYRVMGAISNRHIRWLESARLTILATAANLLPIPGGIMVRTQALRQEGTSYKRALAANAAAGIAWAGMGCLAVGALMVTDAHKRVLSIALLVASVVLIVGVYRLLKRANPHHAIGHLSALMVVETLTVVITAVRIWLAFAMIGKTATPAQAVAQTSAVIIAAAVGIFPSGLGLRELLAGAVGTVVGLDAAAAVAATAADRVAAQIGLAVLAGGLLFFIRHEGKTVEDEIEEAIEAVDEDPYLHPMDLP